MTWQKLQGLDKKDQLADEGLSIRPLSTVRPSSHADATRLETVITSLLSMFSHGVADDFSQSEGQKLLRAPSS